MHIPLRGVARPRGSRLTRVALKMAAASPQQSSQSEEVPADVTRQIVPTLLDIERKKYKLGSNEHYKFTYLAQRLVSGTARSTLEKKKLSQMYSVFENQHGKREALAMMIFLFNSCDDSLAAEKLEGLVQQSDAGHHHRAALSFSGRRVSEEEREKFNFRNLIVRIADELDKSKREDLVTILQDQTGDGDSRDDDYKTILLLMTKACHSGVLEARNPSAKLLEWLNQLGFNTDTGELSVMSQITQFDPMRQFPGNIMRQISTDSAYEEGVEGPQNPPSTSVESYSRDSSLFSRSRSIEETQPQTRAEMVTSKK